MTAVAYRTVATREGRWWVLDVAGVGVTQSRTLADAAPWASGLVEAVTGISNAAIDLHLAGGLDSEVAEAREAAATAQTAVDKAAARSREVVEKLLAQRMTHADAAALLGVSRQRISQLAR